MITDKEAERFFEDKFRKDKARSRYEGSFKDFARECLGLRDMNGVHDEVCEVYQGSGDKNLMFLLPRHSFKSWLITQGCSLWEMVRDPEVRILIYSDVAGKAQGFLSGIKNHILGKMAWRNHRGELGKTRFREFYSNWETDPHKGTWNESEIVISKREGSQIEPSVDTGGIEGSKVGKHYDIIFFDDIVSDINTTTKAQMDKVYECYKKSLALLKPNGKIVIVGTRWHDHETYGRIIADNKDKDNFIIYRRDADEVKDDGELLFADIGLDEKFLAYQKREIGSFLYSALYKNNPVDEETAMFKTDNFRYYKPRANFHENMWITGTCDPAGEGEDFTAITVVGTDSHMNMYVLDAINRHLKPSQIIDEIIRLNFKWGFNKFACERNFYKGMLERDFREAEKEHRSNPNYQPFSFAEDVIASGKNNNFNRVLRLQPKQEHGQIYLPNDTDNFNTLKKVYAELGYQMIRFTVDGSKSPHDDLLISLALHMGIMHKGGTVAADEPDPTSAAGLELEYMNQMARRNSRIPRAYRQSFVPSFNE